MTPIAAQEAASFESNPRPPAGSTPEPVLAPSPAKPRPAPLEPVREIEDPFEMEDELPAVEPRSVSMPTFDIAAHSAPDEEEIPSEASASDTEFPPAPVRPPSSRAGLLAAVALPVALLGVFFGLLYSNRPEAAGSASRSAPSLPLKGQIATFSAIESGWRTRQPGDQVSTVDVTLPTPSRKQPALMPMVRITTEPGATSGFLRFIFIDAEGKISGDVRVVKVNAGTIEPLSSGAKVSGPGTAIIFGSLGFMDRPGFVAYATGASPRWSVEVSESTSYNSKEEGWKKLDTFDLRNASDP